MDMTPRDAQKLREVFRDFKGAGVAVPEVEVDGDDLEIRLCADNATTSLIVPFNEAGDTVAVMVNNAILKRWRAECKEAVTLMRRVASGERNTKWNDMRGSPGPKHS